MKKSAFVVAVPAPAREGRVRRSALRKTPGRTRATRRRLVPTRVIATDKNPGRELDPERSKSGAEPDPDDPAWDHFIKDADEIQEQIDLLQDHPPSRQYTSAQTHDGNGRELKSTVVTTVMNGILQAQTAVERVVLRAEADTALLARVSAVAVTTAKQKLFDVSRELKLSLGAAPSPSTARKRNTEVLREIPLRLARAAYTAGATTRINVTPTRPRAVRARIAAAERSWNLSKSFEWQRDATTIQTGSKSLERMGDWQRERRKSVAYRIVRDAGGVNEAKVARLVLGGSFKLAKSTVKTLGRAGTKQARALVSPPMARAASMDGPVVEIDGSSGTISRTTAPTPTRQPRKGPPSFPATALGLLPMTTLFAVGGAAASSAGIVAATAVATGSIAATVRSSTRSRAMSPDFVYSTPSSYQSEFLRRLAQKDGPDAKEPVQAFGGMPLAMPGSQEISRRTSESITTDRTGTAVDVEAEEREKRAPLSRRVLYLIDSIMFEVEKVSSRAGRRAAAAGILAAPVEGEWQTLLSLQRKKNTGIYK